MARKVFSKLSNLTDHVRAQNKNNSKLITETMEKALAKSVQKNVYDTPEGKYYRTNSLKNIQSETNYKDSNRTYSRVWIAPKMGNSPYSYFGQENIGIEKGDKVYTAWWIDGTTGKKGNGGFVKVERSGVNMLKGNNVRNFTDDAIQEVEKYIRDNIKSLRAKGIIE